MLLRACGRGLFELQLQRERRWRRWQEHWSAEVVAPLATWLARGKTPPDEVTERAIALHAWVEFAPPVLQRSLIRLPSCFHSFDQQPADVGRMVDEFVTRWPDRNRAMAVVGVRSSGSYLAPLCMAFLQAAGYAHLVELTLRSGRWLHAAERVKLRRVVAANGLALLLDDPPASGSALLAVAARLRQIGFPADRIVLLTASFGATGSLPPVLLEYPSVVLPWPDWAIHELLTPASVHAALSELLRGEGELISVEPLDAPARVWARGHISAPFKVRLRQTGMVSEEERQICAEGVGLGYFGSHVQAVADRLIDFAPYIYGLRSGLLFREWLPKTASLSSAQDRRPEDAEGIAAYVAARRQMLPLAEDKSLRLGGRDPVWELAAYVLERSFGRRAARAMRPIVRRTARLLLQPGRPAVVDGATMLDRWFHADNPSGLKKVGFAERDFSNLDAFCCDPVYDLAGVVTSSSADRLGPQLRAAYFRHTSEQVDAERWLLYQLVHGQSRLRINRNDFVSVEADAERALRDYFGETLLAMAILATGPVCAIDIDGVLEVEDLGFVGITPAAALALLALARHDFRSVVVTARSLDDVRARCQAYGLAGGVAEYGAVIYDHTRGLTTDLLQGEAVSALEQVRSLLRRTDGVVLDPRIQRAVRAYRIDRAHLRRALPLELVSGTIAQAGAEGRVRAIQGESQTDFMVAGMDKGVGLRKLLHQLTPPTDLALAVGDSESDLPMLSLAKQAFAPANADRAVRAAGIQITAGAYQLGFVEAVRSLLGHSPGACSACRSPEVSDRTRLLLTVLSAQDRPRWAKLSVAAGLTWRLATQRA